MDDLAEISAGLPTEYIVNPLKDGRRQTKNASHTCSDTPEQNLKGADGRSRGAINKPVHLTIAQMAAAGYTQQEIANWIGYSRIQVGNVLRDPEMQPVLERISEKTVQQEMKTFLEQEVLPTLQFLKTVRMDSKARNQDRISAGRELLDRYLGKAVQPMSSDAKPVAEQTDEELKGQVAAALAKMNQTN